MKCLICLIFILCSQTFLAQNGWILQQGGTTVNLNSVNFDHATSNRAWVCGDSGTILYTTNAGINWNRQNTGTVNNLYGIAYHEDNGTVIAVGAGGIVLRTTNQGTNWINIPTPTTNKLNDISDWRFYAVGDGGTIIHSTNGGLNWFTRDSHTSNDLNSVIGLEPVPIAAGDNGTIVKSDNQGINWVVVNSGTTANLYGVPLVPLFIIAGANGTLLKSTNVGSNWFPLTSGVTFDLNFIGDASGAIYIAGTGGKILKSTNNGNNWFVQNTPTTNDLKSVFFYLFANTGYAVGRNGTILYTTTGGVTAISPVSSTIPGNYKLHQNYPNPFNPVTKIGFDIPITSNIRLNIYDLQGKEIKMLVNEQLNAGIYEVDFDASELPSGVYFCKLTTEQFTESRKMILLK